MTAIALCSERRLACAAALGALLQDRAPTRYLSPLLGEELREKIIAALFCRFVFLDFNSIRVGIGIVTDSGHLPRDLDMRFVGFDVEPIVLYLIGDDRLRELPHHC